MTLDSPIAVSDSDVTLHRSVTNPKHSHVTPLWGTDPEYVAMARTALGGRIELDPMSSLEFNELVKAERIYTEEDDCFAHSWVAETVFLNPAGRLFTAAWDKLLTEYEAHNVQRAIWIGFSVEQLCQLSNAHAHPMDFSWLLPRKRLRFVRHDGYIGSPSHANYVVGIGIQHEVFVSAFEGRGKIGKGSHAITTRPARTEFMDSMRRLRLSSVK